MNMDLIPEQKQTIGQHMIKSMEILQMSAAELETYINTIAMENPVIEITEAARVSEENRSAKDVFLQRKMDWLSTTDHQNRVYYKEDRSDASMQNNWQDINESEETLSEYLLSQLLLAAYTKEERQIVEYIIYSLDSKGYFNEDPQMAGELFGVSAHTILHHLEDVQRLDPAGVGARDLRECLVLQLHRKPDFSKVTETVILFYLNDLAKNHLGDIAKKMDVSLEEIRKACDEIRSFNPKPGNAFSNREQLKYISPDAVVVKFEDQFEILINEYRYPRFTINAYYRELEQTTGDEAAKEYLHEKIRQAKTLQDNIRRRNQTLSTVMHVIVDMQNEFFLKGPGHKKPMRLADIAQTADIHESTVSRTLRGKYVQCTWGIFPLNYFLTNIASRDASGQAQTPEYIKRKMRELIEQENKEKPLSDEAIGRCLQEMDINISRRTVNKYRQEMGIPDKSGRKAWS